LNENLKILAIGDIADNIFTLKKFMKNHTIHLITFPRKGDALLTNSKNGVEFFDSLLISKQVKKIQNIKNEYDICLAVSWAGARIAYLAGLNYLMYFVGGDISTPPFIKNPKLSYLKTPQYNLNFFERNFYKKVFESAIGCIGGQIEYEFLKKYRKDSKRLDKVVVDTTLFNEHVKPINLEKKKFTFISAQRVGLEKGFDKIWDALRLCKTDFQVLQMDWFIQNSKEEKEINEKLMKNKPKQVKFIPLVKREELPKYIMYSDAVLGQMRSGGQGAIERDAVFCKKPVLCYTNPQQKIIINGTKVVPPFLPNNNKPKEIANLIDNIVSSKEFRDEITTKQYTYIMNLCQPQKVVKEWEEIFEKTYRDYANINRKISSINKIEKIFADIIEKLYYKRKMRDKNIKAWGETEYKKLIRD